MVGWRQKELTHWLKHPKTIPPPPPKKKKKFRPENKLFETSFGGLSINFRFSGRISKPAKTSYKDQSFRNTVSLKIHHLFYEPQLTQHYKKYTPATQLQILPTSLANMFLVGGVRWNICTGKFLEAQKLHSQSTLKVNVYIFL